MIKEFFPSITQQQQLNENYPRLSTSGSTVTWTSSERLRAKLKDKEVAFLSYEKRDEQSLLNSLIRLKLYPTKFKGSWLADGKSNTFVIVNNPDIPAFYLTMLKLAIQFDRPNAAIFRNGETYLIGTSRAKDVYPPYGKSVPISKAGLSYPQITFFHNVAGSRLLWVNENKSNIEEDISDLYETYWQNPFAALREADKILKEASTIEVPSELLEFLEK